MTYMNEYVNELKIKAQDLSRKIPYKTTNYIEKAQRANSFSNFLL
jgi:hypothetical protein